MRRVVALVVAALSLLAVIAACGGNGEGKGTATLWVTQDRGSRLLLEARVPAGQTLMRALAAELEIETRYGGRYLQGVAGLEGDLDRQRDWFWFVNGYEGDRSASEYRLRDGDVAWWDYRAWEREGEARVVVGAFPEPFLHGFGGQERRAVVRYEQSEERRAARLGSLVEAESVAPLGESVPDGANVLEVRAGAPALRAELLGESAGDPVRFVLRGSPPPAVRRYAIP